ncbi:MAG: phosphatidylinositol kinase, partial [Nakamurella sp.]
VDHGLTFHTDDKLRTILWGWAGRPLPEVVVAGMARVQLALDAELGEQLDELITISEMRALRDRLDVLLRRKRYPRAPAHRTPIPWPPL